VEYLTIQIIYLYVTLFAVVIVGLVIVIEVVVVECVAVAVKGKAIPLQAWTGPEASRFQDSRHLKVVRLSALHTGRLYPQEIFLVLISVRYL
jgi:hypothetical protein